MEVIQKIQDRFPITAILESVDLPRSTWYYHQNQKVNYREKYADVIDNISEILDEHPGYGYPKIKRQLECEYEETAGFRVVRKLLKIRRLHLKRYARGGRQNGYRKAVSEVEGNLNLLKKKDEVEPFEVLCTDFTEIPYDCGRLRAKWIPIVGYRCKMIFGWALGRNADTELALEAFEEALNKLSELRVDPSGMIMHQDQDAVFTGERWADRLLMEEDFRVSYSENGAKGNTMMESTIGHFKQAAKNLFYESSSLRELEKNVDEQVTYWNRDRMHQGIDYRKPVEFVEESLR